MNNPNDAPLGIILVLLVALTLVGMMSFTGYALMTLPATGPNCPGMNPDWLGYCITTEASE